MLRVKQETVVVTWTDEIVSWKTLLLLGILALILFPLQDLILEAFGLSLTEFIQEFVILTLLMVLATLAIAAAVSLLSYFLDMSWRWLFFLNLMVLVPTAIFFMYAHFEMSHALAPLKQTFAKVADVSGAHGKSGEIGRVLAARDDLLQEYCYTKLGGWRISGGESDCSAIYIFTACWLP